MVGGDFQQTTWGTPDYVEPAMAWLADRAYIQFADASALRSRGMQSVLPGSPIARSAIETQFALAGADPALAANYAGVENSLWAASAWAHKPSAGAVCASVCILSSGQFYAVLDPRGGRLVFFFAGPTELIGPTAQFFIGFSDRSEWNLSRGEDADPQQVMGAFADADDAYREYQAEVLGPQTIRFTACGVRVKTYRLGAAGLQVQLSGPVDTQIPLVVDPQSRFVSGWAERYALQRAPGRLGWGPASGPTVWVAVSGSSYLSLSSVFDARALLLNPEDPNLEYPPGVYLPFQMAMARFSSSSTVVVSLSTSEK